MSITDLIPGFSWLKLALWAVGLSAIVGIVILINGWRTQARDLSAWQSVVIEAVTDATVPPDKNGIRKLLKPGIVAPAIRALASDRDDARRSLTNIDDETRAIMARADAADKRLAEQQQEWARQAATSAATIDRLKHAQSTGNADQDAALIETDSQAPWKGWR